MKFPPIKDIKKILCVHSSNTGMCTGMTCDDCVLSVENEQVGRLKLSVDVHRPITLTLEEERDE